MTVSFIIPLYNCLAHTREALRTLASSLPAALAHEIILVDDGSTDGTREWLQTLSPSHRVVLNDRNLGYAAANNRGAALARGELLVLLNNDLLFAPGWLEPMLAVHHRLPHPGVIGNVQRNAASGLLDHTGIVFDRKGKPAHDTSLPLHLAIHPGHRPAAAVTGACALLSTALWRELGGFDEGYRNGGEDIDLCLRARAAGRSNAVALRSTVLHHVSASPGRRQHDEANSRRLTLRWRREIAALSARAWSQHHLETAPGHVGSLGVLAYWAGWSKTPPALVREGVDHALAQEIARWERLFG
ncbi:MAG TPA: glycosyltransferase family 2 protein [Opitutaceae bacterium]|nr:glycosyltransferase family 2 protein [Opitutaceae bacterium]HRJ46572.1 glycosyltransferase family 2 protein [Opitutaceae bacterium]